MKKVVLLLLAFVTFGSAAAQSIVVLKNGVTLEGAVVEHSNDEITVNTADGDTFVYRRDEIKSVSLSKEEKAELAEKAKELKAAHSAQAKSRRAEKYGYNGYKGIVEVGYGVNNYTDLVNSLQVAFINGVQIGQHFYMGLGVGVFCNAIDEPEKYVGIPVFLDLRVPFVRYSGFSPYLGAKIGYDIQVQKGSWWDGDYYNDDFDCYNRIYTPFTMSGLYFEPSLGFNINFNKRNSLILSFGAPLHIVKFEKARAKEVWCNYLGKIGFSF